MPLVIRSVRAWTLLNCALLAACGAKTPASTPQTPQSEVPDGTGGGGGAAAPSADGGSAAGQRSGAVPGGSPGTGKDIPKACASRDADLCFPDPAFVKRLCDGSFPDVALGFFEGSSPWTRGYLTRDVDGWNAEGGSAARSRLAFDEEVVLLRRRLPPKGGIQVGSGAGYLVLRVDGSCYTLDDLELTRKRPPKPKSGPVTFRYLETKLQDALLTNARIAAAADKRRKECKGATSGTVTKACESADAELARAVPEEVRKGMALPTPIHVP